MLIGIEDTRMCILTSTADISNYSNIFPDNYKCLQLLEDLLICGDNN